MQMLIFLSAFKYVIKIQLNVLSPSQFNLEMQGYIYILIFRKTMLLLEAFFCLVTFCHFASLSCWSKQQTPAAPFLLSQCFGAVSSQQAQLSFSYQSKVLVKHCSDL